MSLQTVEQRPQLTEAERLELAEVLYAIETRRRLNPLEFLELLPVQKLFFDCVASLILFFGGNRSGKTTPVAAKVTDEAIKRPKMKIWVVGETFQDSVAIQQRKIWELCPKQSIKYGRYDEINGFTNRKLLFDNGSLITFKSFDQGREAFQSDDIDLIWFDEEPPLDIVKECRMRLVDRNGRMIISMTSLKGITELVADLFEDCDVLQSRFAPLVNKTLPMVAEKNGAKIFFNWTVDNVHINQDRLAQEIELMSEEEILARIYGMPNNLSGKIYMAFNKQIHVMNIDDVPTQGNQLWNVLDPHDRKPWAIGWYLVNRNGSIYCVDEYPNRPFNDMTFDDKTYGEYAQIIKDKESSLKKLFNIGSGTKRVIDPNFGNKTVQLAERQGGQAKTTPRKELEKHGLKYNDGIDALEAGHLKVRENLHWKKHESGEITVQPKIFFVSTCQNHITGLSRYSRKDISGADGDVKDKVAPQDKYKDFPDLVRYLSMANPRWIEVKKFDDTIKRTY